MHLTTYLQNLSDTVTKNSDSGERFITSEIFTGGWEVWLQCQFFLELKHLEMGFLVMQRDNQHRSLLNLPTNTQTRCVFVHPDSWTPNPSMIAKLKVRLTPNQRDSLNRFTTDK